MLRKLHAFSENEDEQDRDQHSVLVLSPKFIYIILKTKRNQDLAGFNFTPGKITWGKPSCNLRGSFLC